MRGRGRLSSLDLLPEEAQDDLVWACQELYAAKRTQADILFEFNDRLAVKGIEPISRSAFNRRAIKLAASLRRMQETKEIFSALSAHLDPERLDEHSVALGEFLKQVVFELIQPGAAALNPQGAMMLSRAFRDILHGQKISAERRAQLEKEFATKASRAVEKIAGQRGTDPTTIEAIKAALRGEALAA
jgi:hypothetical protein